MTQAFGRVITLHRQDLRRATTRASMTPLLRGRLLHELQDLRGRPHKMLPLPQGTICHHVHQQGSHITWHLPLLVPPPQWHPQEAQATTRKIMHPIMWYLLLVPPPKWHQPPNMRIPFAPSVMTKDKHHGNAPTSYVPSAKTKVTLFGSPTTRSPRNMKSFHMKVQLSFKPRVTRWSSMGFSLRP